MAYHDSCHALRELRSRTRRARCCSAVEGLELSSSRSADAAAGSAARSRVRYPDVSVAMADSKLADVAPADVDALVSVDGGCLLHLGGRAVAHRLAGAHASTSRRCSRRRSVSDHLTGTTFEQRAAEQLVKPFQRQAIPGAVDGTVRNCWDRFERDDRAGAAAPRP